MTDRKRDRRTWVLGFSRVALAAGFLSAVADRLGMWGPVGAEGVVWGNFEQFVAYVVVLNPWAPPSLAWAIGVFVTVLEVVLAALLLVGWRLRESALVSGVLLVLFGLAMAVFTGLKGPLDYSVFAASAAALLLYECLGATSAERKSRMSDSGALGD